MYCNFKKLVIAAMLTAGVPVGVVAQEVAPEAVALRKPMTSAWQAVPSGPEAAHATAPDGRRSAKTTAQAQAKQAPSLKGKGFVNKNITVCEGSATNAYCPIYGDQIADTGTESQWVYPASKLTAQGLQKGDQITSITFYHSGNVGSDIASPTFQFGIGEISGATITESNYESNRANATLVYSGKVSSGSTQITITFSTPYTWNGGNLIVDSYVSSSSIFNSATTTWFGETQSGNTALCHYVTGALAWKTTHNDNIQFLPKTTFGIKRVASRNVVVKGYDFFNDITYSWTDDNGGSHTSKLTDIATDPAQMIAMIRELYTNKTIPGNYWRGFDENGDFEDWSECYYSGVGGIDMPGTTLNTLDSYSYVDYGWGIPGTMKLGTSTNVYNGGSAFNLSSTAYYCHLDTTQYKPNEEGLTMLLAEMTDDFSTTKLDAAIAALGSDATNEQILKVYLQNSIKSLRVLTEARRQGSGLGAGTLFKLDCDKMNKFFLLAKGQLRLMHNSYYARTDIANGSDYYRWIDRFFAPPANFYWKFKRSGSSTTHYVDGWTDEQGFQPFYHMFEQLSPSNVSGNVPKADLYKDLINMTSFDIVHDCGSVAYYNHQFMMYGNESAIDDCQDIRDLMIFIPDYRMVKDDDRDTNEAQRYLNYNKTVKPTMGLYVIRQDEIVPNTKADEYYMLTLNWRTNLDDFLPGEDQEFQLYEVVKDNDGNESYEPVYYMNAQGEYTDADGNVVGEDNKVAIKLQLGSGAEKSYTQVYVKRLTASQQKTYAVRGQDAGHFLSLQMSNQQSIIIPGLDPGEMALLMDVSHYSRFDAKRVRNCYSNKLQLSNNAEGIRNNYLVEGTTFEFTRYSLDESGEMIYEGQKVLEQVIARAKVTKVATKTEPGEIEITMSEQASKDDFPAAANGVTGAGYHANKKAITYTLSKIYENYVDLGKFIIYDNFITDSITDNSHPGMYAYRMAFTTAVPFKDINGKETTDAYSNVLTIPVYKTGTKINGEFTLDDVLADATGEALTVDSDVKFDEQVRYSSKTDILRYDAYRFSAADEHRYILSSAELNDDVAQDNKEGTVTPNGIASNEGNFYSVTMNAKGTDFYRTSEVEVEQGGTAWATFTDPYPAANAGAYVYAPVVETFTTGKDVNEEARTDYNTYGGPVQTAASGNLIVNVQVPDPAMSSYSWTGTDGNKYAYYNVNITVDTKNIPEGYEIYKVRAWREIDGLAGEQYEEMKDRSSKTFAFEDITYPDYSLDAATVLGATRQDATVTDQNGQQVTYTSYRGTFGAQKVGEGDGCASSLTLKYKVRIYFTLKSNLKGGSTATTASMKALAEAAEVEPGAKFYVVEATATRTLTASDVPTAVENISCSDITGVKYYNALGVASDKPFKGVNIVVTTHADGTATTQKILK